MLMMGTFFVAEGVEACGLHRRIALAILSILGNINFHIKMNTNHIIITMNTNHI